jgi:SAM-dependent methyltransferase
MISTVGGNSDGVLKHNCTVCGSASTVPVITLDQVPILCSVQWPSRQEAIHAPRGTIELSFCSECGHLFNSVFDASLMQYSDAYDCSLHFSASFNQYAEALADRLIAKYQLNGKDIVEIGCGKGEFLTMLCERGENRGLGFDVSYEPGRAHASERITFIKDYFQEKYLESNADLVVCRHVLEHIPQPASFLAAVRQALGERMQTAVYFEVPNALFTLEDLGVWDLIYEHCSYFSPSSLRSAFAHSGFHVTDMDIAFDGQFLSIEAMPDPDASRAHKTLITPRENERLERLSENVGAFRESYLNKLGEWHARLKNSCAQHKRTVLWGAGAKGVMFLNALDLGSVVEYVVDINPHKQGLYIAGTGQQIVSPEFLADYKPDAVIVMNPIYQDEIKQQLDLVGAAAEVCCAN